MSNNVIIKINKCCDIPIKELENLWNNATHISQKNDYKIIMTAFKASLFHKYPSCEKLWKIGKDCFSLKDAELNDKSFHPPEEVVFFDKKDSG